MVIQCGLVRCVGLHGGHLPLLVSCKLLWAEARLISVLRWQSPLIVLSMLLVWMGGLKIVARW